MVQQGGSGGSQGFPIGGYFPSGAQLGRPGALEVLPKGKNVSQNTNAQNFRVPKEMHPENLPEPKTNPKTQTQKKSQK